MKDTDVLAEPEGATPLDPDEREGLRFPHHYALLIDWFSNKLDNKTF